MSEFTIIDTHCHLDIEAFDADRDAVWRRARENGVCDIVIPAVTADHWAGLLALCDTDPGLHPALGLHPVYLEQHAPGDPDMLPDAIARSRPVAVGEIGLDFAIRELDRERQVALLERQFDIAEDFGLPVILHVRKAHDDMIRLLQRRSLPGGTVHAFNGSIQQGLTYVEMGFKLGFGGMLTFERSRRLRQLVVQLPASALVLETDAPDLTVASHQGERNSPEYLPQVLQAMAEARGESPREVAGYTSANAREVFSLP
ncbi:MAG: TatD family hydrolase [Gammaproteobacteria bacterium]|jgi:TatD DNase family protein